MPFKSYYQETIFLFKKKKEKEAKKCVKIKGSEPKFELDFYIMMFQLCTKNDLKPLTHSKVIIK